MPRRNILKMLYTSSIYIPSTAKITVPIDRTTLVSSVTVGCWVKKSNNSPRTTFPVVFALWGIQQFFTLGSATNAVSLNGQTNDIHNRTVATSLGVDTRNSWEHLVATYDGTTISLYVNGIVRPGALVTSGPFSGNSTQDVVFGTYNGGGNDYVANFQEAFVGTFMTADEIKRIYDHGIFNTSKLRGLYPLNEGAGTTATDTSGNGNNGTITNGSWSTDTPTGVRTATGTRTAAEVRPLVNQNLVYNGDFSIAPAVNVPQTTAYRWLDGTATGIVSAGITDFTGKIYGIYYWDRTSGAGSIMIDTTERMNGKNSLKISPSTAGTANTASIGAFFVGQYISVLPNTSYTLTGWMKTNYISGDSVSGARFYSVLKNGARGDVTTTTHTAIKTTTDWTFYTRTFTTGATIRFATILMQIAGNSGAATLLMDAWFADIVLKPTTATVRAIA